MRRAAWLLLLLFTFAVPWEHSLDLGEPFGSVARLAGLLLLAVTIPALLLAGRMRRPGALSWLVLALYLWFCCTALWSIDLATTLDKLRAFFQEMMIVWLLLEFAESPRDLRLLLRAAVFGCWILAALTLIDFRSAEAVVAEQLRFAAYGQDPNDVARFLDLGFPLAALLAVVEEKKIFRIAAFLYLPVGLLAVLLTASRGGFVAALLAVAGSAFLLLRGRLRAQRVGLFVLPALVVGAWFAVPHTTLERLATIPEQLRGGGLNQRIEIWSLGWRAFTHAPVFGSGMGTFVSAAGLAPADTAHNTALALAVGGGLCALSLAAFLFFVAIRAALQAGGALRIALLTALAVWLVTAMVGTVEESRFTWLLLGFAALAGRMAGEGGEALSVCFQPCSTVAQSSVQPAELPVR